MPTRKTSFDQSHLIPDSVLKSHIKKCHPQVVAYIAKLIKERKKLLGDCARITAANTDLLIKLELCNEGIIDQRKSNEQLSKLSSEQKSKMLLDLIEFEKAYDNKMSKLKK